MTVSRRLLLILLPALALLMFGADVIDYRISLSTTRNLYDQALGNATGTLAAYVRERDGRLSFESPGAGRFELERYAVVGPDGALLAGDPLLAERARQHAATDRYLDVDAQGKRLRVARIVSGAATGPVTIYGAESAAQLERAERAMLVGRLSVDFVALDLILLLIWISVNVGLRPLRRLQDEVESRTTRGLRAFDEGAVPGEVRTLVRAFNRLLALLQDAGESQRRFVANAAHQLRTPIAGLSAQLELLLQSAAATPVLPELETIHRGIARVAHSANQLLSLARTEQSTTQTEHLEVVALRPLLADLIGRNIDRADSLGLDLGAELQESEVRGDSWMLQDLSSNLLDNALKYTPRGGHVTVRCGREQDGAPFIEVEDDGPGIPESDRHSVRERFYRRPGASAPGIGLGLAIVDEIARLHLARFTIHAGAANTGARMRVRFEPGLGL